MAFEKGGQKGWYHEDNLASGYFHTYDCLKVAGEHDIGRKVHVFLPREYEHDVSARYSVIYMNDGNTAFWNGGFGKSWNVAKTLENIYTSPCYSKSKFIVVAIHPNDREYEYTLDMWMIWRSYGGLEGYAKYIADCLKPWIDANYRTLASPQHTTIMGSSHGGLAAFFIGTKYPGSFGFAACLSSSFWAGLDMVSLFKSLESASIITKVQSNLQDPTKRPKLWIDWGCIYTGGFHNMIIETLAAKRSKEMVDLLKNKFAYKENEDLFYYQDINGDHTEVSWCKRFPMILKAFYGI